MLRLYTLPLHVDKMSQEPSFNLRTLTHLHIHTLLHQQRLLYASGCPGVRSLLMQPWIIDTALILVLPSSFPSDLVRSCTTSHLYDLKMAQSFSFTPTPFPIDSTEVLHHYNYLTVHIN